MKEGDLRGLFEGLGIKAVRIGMDRETGQSRVSNRGGGAAGLQLCWVLGSAEQAIPRLGWSCLSTHTPAAICLTAVPPEVFVELPG